MLLIDCPHCGPRAEVEFRFAGEAHLIRPAGDDVGDAAWSDYLFMRDNRRGASAERWRHIHGCGQFFNAVRNTFTDKFECSYPAGTLRPNGAGIA